MGEKINIMRKRFVLAVTILLAIGMTSCSLEPIEESPNSGAITGSQMANDGNAGAGNMRTEVETEKAEAESEKTEPVKKEKESAKTEDEKAEIPETENTGDGTDSPQRASIVVSVESYKDEIIVVKDQGTDSTLYFSTKEAEVIEGDAGIATGDLVEIFYNEEQGDEEHPGTAVKVVELSMRQCTITASVESYENGVIAVRDIDSDLLLYFSMQEAEMVEGDAPVTIGDTVELTYRGVQGDEEHPGIAVKVVVESKNQ